jgi:protoporphyrinogen oxidase
VTEVLVVGGGPAGLAAALTAARRGFETRLVETGAQLGGMAASFEVAGLRVDHGSHRLHPAASAPVIDLLDELLGSDLQLRERRGRIRLWDRWLAFPFRPLELVRTAPPTFTAAAARDLVTRPWRRPTGDSYAEVVRVGLGPAALEAFHRPMATKLWGVDPDGLAGELARRRLRVRSPGGLARRLLATSRSDGRGFLYPRRGFGQIVDRLAEAATDAGAVLDTATTVQRVDPAPSTAGGGPAVTLGGSTATRVGRILWTAPPAALARVVGDPPGGRPPPAPRHRGLTLAYLVLPTPRWSPYDAHYVADPRVGFSRLSEPRNYRDSDDDPPDRTVLCAELPCTPGDDLWTADTGAVVDRVTDGMDRLGLEVGSVAGAELRRLPAVYPVLEESTVAGRRRQLAWCDALPGVTVLGRHGRIVADNLHHVIDMAITAVDCLGPDGAWDATAWAAATDRFETFVIED